jgi:DNA-binding transcriptional LysR family regulator
VDRYNEMSVFARIVESGSFTSAARQLGMSPAMVSTHIRTLERRLGVRLLNRTTRRVKVTEVGQDYYERCLRILHELDAAERAASDLQIAPRGRIRLTAPMTFGVSRLGPLIAEYLKAYPEVSIDFSLDDRNIDLVEEGFDLAICVGRLADSRLIARKVTMAQAMLCASRAYIGKHGAPKSPRELRNHNCLTYAAARTNNDWSFFDAGGAKETVRVSGRFIANNGDALRRVALAGVGIILAPDFIVEEDLKAGRLITLLPEHKAAVFPFHAVYPQSRYLSAKVKTFVDYLIASFDRASGDTARRLFNGLPDQLVDSTRAGVRKTA